MLERGGGSGSGCKKKPQKEWHEFENRIVNFDALFSCILEACCWFWPVPTCTWSCVVVWCDVMPRDCVICGEDVSLLPQRKSLWSKNRKGKPQSKELARWLDETLCLSHSNQARFGYIYHHHLVTAQCSPLVRGATLNAGHFPRGMRAAAAFN